MREKGDKLIKTIFSVDNAFVRACERVLDLLVLNLLFLLTCLPIVTVGIAKLSLYEVLEALKAQKRLPILASYRAALGRNAKKGFGIGLLEVALTVLCLLDFWIIGQVNPLGAKLFQMLFMAIFFLSTAIFLYVYPLATKTNLLGKELFKTAFILSGLHFPWTFLMIGSLAGLFLILFASVWTLLLGLSLFLLLGMAVLGYGWVWVMEIVFQKHSQHF
ncbi:putative membrane protein YesL [Streptococcus rupicaprae]|uniref:Membrane protein YesL n=1 Tax=Streptococcus rupicaprae TaxID=759619 RepID=A0ABV2FK07_9STRE